MYSIFNSYLLKLTGTMAGLAFFSFALQAQEPVPADSVKAGQAEKVRMPYHVKGRVVDAVTGQGFAGARITTPNVNVSAMTDVYALDLYRKLNGGCQGADGGKRVALYRTGAFLL